MKAKKNYISGLLLAITIAAVTVSGGAVPEFIVSAFSGPALPDKTVTLTVTVKNENGEEVPNALVNVYLSKKLVPDFLADTFPSDYQALTTAKGVATIIIKVKEGDSLRFLLEVSHEDLQVRKETIIYGKVFPSELSKEYRLLPQAKGTGASGATTTFHISVIRPGGEAVEGAKVTVYSTLPYRVREYSGVTNDKGEVVIVTPLNNEFKVTASKALFGQASQTFNTKNYPTDIPGVELTLQKQVGAAVTVNVIDEETKRAIGDAVVVMDSKNSSGYYSESTDTLGNAHLSVPETGSFAVRITQDFYEPFDGEARLVAGEDSKTFEFKMKAKPKKATGRSSIAVTVLQGDKFARIEGGNLPFPGATVKAAGANETTNRSGKATISDFFEENVEVAVEAEGYKRQVKSVKLSEQQRYSGGTANVTFLMYKESSEDVIEVTVTASKKGIAVPLAGVTVTAGGESTTTRSDGRAKLSGDFPDSVEVTVEKDGFIRQARTISASGGKGTASFVMENQPDEDSVTITVAAQDSKGGSASPLASAVVTANGLTATTDRSGTATITGNFKDGVDVEAKADGFSSQIQKVTIKQPERTAAANFVLKPLASLSLLVEVRESADPHKPVTVATVYVRRLGTPIGSAPLATKETDQSTGDALIEIKGDADTMSRARAGLTIHVVGTEDYQQGMSDIDGVRLQQTTDPIKWVVYLKRDWTPLAKAISALEPRVTAWNNDVSNAKKNIDIVRKLGVDAKQALSRSTALLREIEGLGATLGGTNGVSTVGSQCSGAARLRSNIQGYKTEAGAKENALKARLDAALTLAASCSTTAMGDGVRNMFRNATQLARDINDLEKKARKDNADLKNLAGENTTVTKSLFEVESKLAQLRQESAKADAAAASAGTTFIRAENLGGRHATLSNELNQLKNKYGLNVVVDGFPPDLDKRIENLTKLLGQHNNRYFDDADVNLPKIVQDAAADIQRDRAKAEKLLAQFKSGLSGSCNFEPVDDLVESMGALSTSATIELGAAALDEKAEACVKKGNCQPKIDDALLLMENGGPELAAGKIAEARSLGCEMGKIDEQLDYWKTIRDGVVYLKALETSCEFREAYNVTLNIPASIRKKPIMADAISRIYDGKKAQDIVFVAGQNAAAEVARTGRNSSANPFLAQAEKAAASFPCLVKEVSNLRDKYKTGPSGPLGYPVDKPKIEEIPDDATDAGEILAGVSNHKTKGGKPVIEDRPDDIKEQPNTPQKQPGEKNTTQSKPAKEKKPKTGPGFWEKLGNAAVIAANEIAKNGRNQTGTTGGSNTGGATYPQSGGNQFYAFVLDHGIGLVLASQQTVNSRGYCQWAGGGTAPCPQPAQIIGNLGGPYASVEDGINDLKTKLDCQSGYWGLFIRFGGGDGRAWLQNNVGTNGCRTVKQL